MLKDTPFSLSLFERFRAKGAERERDGGRDDASRVEKRAPHPRLALSQSSQLDGNAHRLCRRVATKDESDGFIVLSRVAGVRSVDCI